MDSIRQFEERSFKEQLVALDKLREENKRKYEKIQQDYDGSQTQYPDINENENENENDVHIGVTSIDDLPSDDSISDRYRHPTPINRVKLNEGSYIETEDLFKGEQTNMRKSLQSIDAKTKKSKDIITRAKELEQSREEAPAPPGHPRRK